MNHTGCDIIVSLDQILIHLMVATCKISAVEKTTSVFLFDLPNQLYRQIYGTDDYLGAKMLLDLSKYLHFL